MTKKEYYLVIKMESKITKIKLILSQQPTTTTKQPTKPPMSNSKNDQPMGGTNQNKNNKTTI